MGLNLTRDLVGGDHDGPNVLEYIEQTVYHMEIPEVQYKTMRLPSAAPEDNGIPREAGQDTVMKQPPQYRDSTMDGQLQGAPCTTV